MKHATHPRTTHSLIGLKRQESRLLEQWYENRLPHACLFSGPQGVGKATLAYRLARFILSGEGNADAGGPSLFGDALPPVHKTSLDVSADHPAAHRIAAGTHPDLLVLEPEFDEKKGTYKSDIPVEAARKVGHFLSQTSSEGGWKVIIIDPVDALNTNAANAILKWLEEPPPYCLFLLISHQPGGLLPTIISRCQVVGFSLQEPAEFAALLAERGVHASDSEVALLQRLSGGSAGLATTLHFEHAESHYHEILAMLAKGNDPALLTFAEKITSGKEAPSWNTLERIFSAILGQIIKLASGIAPQGEDAREIDILRALSARKPLDYWLDLWENGSRLLSDAERLYLNKKHALLAVLFSLCGKEHAAEAIR
jgi:DNA polymerase-3 subunit delta'